MFSIKSVVHLDTLVREDWLLAFFLQLFLIPEFTCLYKHQLFLCKKLVSWSDFFIFYNLYDPLARMNLIPNI